MMGSTDRPRVRPNRLSLPEGSAPQPPLKHRAESLESTRVQTLRGLACLLLVAFHTVGASANSGLHVRDDSWYREFTNLFVHIRMPLFTFLSGFVYAYRPLRSGQALRFSARKVRRLGVPFVVASTVLYGLHFALHHEVPPPSRMWTVYVFPFWHMWFVQSLLVVFAALVVLESLGGCRLQAIHMVFMLSLVLFLYGPLEGLTVLGLHHATYLLPFFLWGLGVHRYRDKLQTTPSTDRERRVFHRQSGFP